LSSAGFEQSCRRGAKDEAANMRHVRNTVTLHSSNRSDFTEQLHNEPHANKEERRYKRHARKSTNHQN
jgi:hypothetical protein